MLQQFTNLSNALCPAIAKHSIAHRLTLVSLSPDTVGLSLQPLTFPQNPPLKITQGACKVDDRLSV